MAGVRSKVLAGVGGAVAVLVGAVALGPRVHFEVRYRNTPQNPDDWLGS